jgi:hypothetical protein
MKDLMNWITRTNEWYDNIGEPFRFLFAVFLIMAPYLLCTWFLPETLVNFLQAFWIIALVIWRFIPQWNKAKLKK